MTWDPSLYLAFGDERTRPARELLARIEMEAPTHVVDLGCGPGNSTALLAARWPAAELEGIDNSEEMLSQARKNAFAARWMRADVAEWNPHQSYDVVFSNATLHWVPHQARLLPQIVRHVAKSGVFAFQVPRNFSEPCHTLIYDVAKAGPWRLELERVRAGNNVCPPETYFDILEPLARTVDIWETRYVQVLDGEDAVYRWMMGTALRPFAEALTGEERDAFLAEYRLRVGEAYPRRASGVTLYPFQRLFCVMRS